MEDEPPRVSSMGDALKDFSNKFSKDVKAGVKGIIQRANSSDQDEFQAVSIPANAFVSGEFSPHHRTKSKKKTRVKKRVIEDFDPEIPREKHEESLDVSQLLDLVPNISVKEEKEDDNQLQKWQMRVMSKIVGRIDVVQSLQFADYIQQAMQMETLPFSDVAFVCSTDKNADEGCFDCHFDAHRFVLASRGLSGDLLNVHRASSKSKFDLRHGWRIWDPSVCTLNGISDAQILIEIPGGTPDLLSALVYYIYHGFSFCEMAISNEVARSMLDQDPIWIPVALRHYCRDLIARSDVYGGAIDSATMTKLALDSEEDYLNSLVVITKEPVDEPELDLSLDAGLDEISEPIDLMATMSIPEEKANQTPEPIIHESTAEILSKAEEIPLHTLSRDSLSDPVRKLSRVLEWFLDKESAMLWEAVHSRLDTETLLLKWSHEQTSRREFLSSLFMEYEEGDNDIETVAIPAREIFDTFLQLGVLLGETSLVGTLLAQDCSWADVEASGVVGRCTILLKAEVSDTERAWIDLLTRSPLLLSVLCSHRNLAENLLRAGADPNGTGTLLEKSSTVPSTESIPSPEEFLPELSVQLPDLCSTPLGVALCGQREDIAALIIQWGGTQNPAWLPRFVSIGAYTAVRFMIEHGVDANYRDVDMRTPLHHACSSFQRLMALFLMDSSANVNAVDKNGTTPLHLVAQRCKVEEEKEQVKIASDLVVRGASVTARDNMDMTPLMYALMNGRFPYSLAERLIPLCSLNSDCGSGGSYLDWIVRLKDRSKLESSVPEICIWMLKKGADVEGSNKRSDGQTPLHGAVLLNDKETAQILLQAGASVMKEDSEGTSPEWLALSGGKDRIEVIQTLHSNSIVDPSGDVRDQISLEKACRQGDSTIVGILLDRGAEPNHVHVAVSSGHTNIVSMLLGSGGDGLIPNDQGVTPLEESILIGNESTFSVLLESVKSKIGKVPWLGCRALWAGISILEDNPESLSTCLRLLGAGVTVDYAQSWSKNMDLFQDRIMGGTLLHRAAHEGRLQAVLFLLSHGANPNDNRGWAECRPVHAAAWCRHESAAQITSALINADADPWVRDFNGRTALHWCLLAMNEPVADVYLQASPSSKLLSIADLAGRTALDLAFAGGNVTDVGKRLVELGCDVNVPLSVQAHELLSPLLPGQEYEYQVQTKVKSNTLFDQYAKDVALQRDRVNSIVDELTAVEGLPDISQFESMDATPVIEKPVEKTPAVPFLNKNHTGTLLHRAARSGHLSVVEFLLNFKGTDVSILDAKCRTALHVAAESGFAEIVELMVEIGMYLNWRVPSYANTKIFGVGKVRAHSGHLSGSTPLHLAVQSSQIDVVSKLLSLGCDPNVIDDLGRTPLQIALWKDLWEIADLLFCNKADVNCMGSSSDEVDSLTRRERLSLISDDEFEAGNATAPVTTEGCTTDTILHAACQDGLTKAAIYLLNHGARCTIQNASGITPLHVAAGLGLDTICEEIIQHGADPESLVNMVDCKGRTPLHMACLHANVVSLLLARGADPNAVDKDGNTAMHRACQLVGSALPVVRALISRGANPLSANSAGQTPLHCLALGHGDVRVARLLLAGRTEISKLLDWPDKEGWTALHCASFSDHRELARTLTMAGATVNISDSNGRTPLDVDGSVMEKGNGDSENIVTPIQRVILSSIQDIPEWVENSESLSCQICQTKFTVRNRRHHCRNCGRIVCGQCSPYDHPISKLGLHSPVRVCLQCFAVLVSDK